MLKYTLHNHTYLCKHAIGDSKTMIEQAINDKFEIIGISDHIAYPITATQYRMEYQQRLGYLADLKQLKNDYQNKALILRGFEAEYQVEYLDYLKLLFEQDLIDYLVLGQHYQDVNQPETYYGRNMDLQRITEYVDRCISAFETGLFLFIAHPDLFLSEDLDFTPEIKVQCIRLIKAAQANNVYLELNAGGLRNNKRFPNNEFFELVAFYQAPVIINSDSHHPKHINDEYLQQAYEIALDLKLNLANPDLQSYLNKQKR